MNIDKKAVASGFAIALSGATLMATTSARACSTDPFLGSICITAATYCPANMYIEANGQMLAVSQYQALFSLLGTNYGGDGRSTFGIPDLRARTPVGAGTVNGLSPVPIGTKRGIDYMKLTIQQLPAHTHIATFTPQSGGASASVQASTNPATKPQVAAGDYIASNKALGGDPKFIPAADAGTTVALGGVSGGGGGGGSVQVEAAGGGGSFANYPPQLAVKYCIAVQGVYPTRP
jgi:microcystin-dependent protein